MRMIALLALGVLALGLAAGLWVYRDTLTLPKAGFFDKAETATTSIEIERFTLSNGMQVVLLPNDRVPAVSHSLWLRVGAADDPPGKSGLAHYHEHLMFKATKAYGAGKFTRRIEALGGEFNAFTGHDYTGYYVNIAREHLATVMALEAERIQHLSPAKEVYATERAVIVEERQTRIGNRPAALLSEQLNAALYLHHPYRKPIIGWMHEIKDLKAEDARAFYRKYYHAGNMVLIVAGDISRAELEPLAERYYGRLSAREPSPRQWVSEPPPRAARRVQMTHPQVRQPRWQRRYLAPSYGTERRERVMPLSLLAEWLGGGKTSLLYRALVEEQKLAVSVSADYSAMSRGPTQFYISASPAEGVSLAVLEHAIDEVLAKARQQQLDQQTLERIKTQFKASIIYARDGLSALAFYAGYLTMLDLPLSYLTDWERHVEAVNPEQIQQAAKLVIQPERSVTGYLYPETNRGGAETHKGRVDAND